MKLTNVKKSILAVLLPLALIACLAPSMAWATIEEGDQSQPSDEEIAAAIAAGLMSGGSSDSVTTNEDALPYQALGAQSQGTTLGTQASKVSSSPYTIKEYSGPSMYETAVSQAKAAYKKSKTAIIAGPGDAWVDALASAGLAATKGPILFSEKNAMNDASLQALKDLGVESVVIVGGTAAVGKGVEKDLENAGIKVEKRLGGSDCFDTQMKIYEYGLENNCWSGNLAIVATAWWFGDALSVSPVAYKLKAPIFLVANNGTLNSAQKAAWKKAAGNGMFKKVEAVGGPAVISQKTIDYGNQMIKAAGGSGEVAWVYGDSQYETSSAIADYAVKNQDFKWDNVAFTTGKQPYDALAGSVYQGATNSVMLLADSAHSSTISSAYSHRSSIKTMRFFGGKRALSSNTRIGIADKFGIPYASIPNFKLYLDAGHGPNDMGNGYYAGGASAFGYDEYDLTRELAGNVAYYLRNDYGVDLFLNDDGGPYRYRHAEAVAEGCDMIVSIHFNAGGGSGTLALVHSYNDAEMSWPLAQKVYPYLRDSLSLHSYGIWEQEVAILGGQLPATLLETCFIDNWTDLSMYLNNKYTVARNIAKGIVS